MKATEKYFPVVMFIMMYKVVVASESVDNGTIQMKAIEQYVFLELRLIYFTIRWFLSSSLWMKS